VALVCTPTQRRRGMTAETRIDRLAPQDFYRQLDWIRDEWHDPDEYLFTRKLVRLERTYQRLPARYYEAAVPLIVDLGWDRVIAKRPWRSHLMQLRGIVSQWHREREAVSG
jgi:hypothetical protein